METTIKSIIKKLKSGDDNDKFAALLFITKAWSSPKEMFDSPYFNDVWRSLRSTKFLERALKFGESQNLVFNVISVFLNKIQPDEFLVFLPILKSLFKENESSIEIFGEIIYRLEDASIVFDYIEINAENIPLIARISNYMRKCEYNYKLISARSKIFSYTKDHVFLEEHLFILVTNLCKVTSYKFALFSDSNTLDIKPFLVILRLAMIEIHLQLDTPVNYKEIQEQEIKQFDEELKDLKSMKEEEDSDELEAKIEPVPFKTKIGPIINNSLSTSACYMLEIGIYPLVNFQDSFNDEEVLEYFHTINDLIREIIEIIKEIDIERDKDRIELKLLLSVFAIWLREAHFLSGNESFINNIQIIMNILKHLPDEAIQFLPAFSLFDENILKLLNKANFSDVYDPLFDKCNENERTVLDRISRIT